jgi:hypothetical protein
MFNIFCVILSALAFGVSVCLLLVSLVSLPLSLLFDFSEPLQNAFVDLHVLGLHSLLQLTDTLVQLLEFNYGGSLEYNNLIFECFEAIFDVLIDSKDNFSELFSLLLLFYESFLEDFYLEY